MPPAYAVLPTNTSNNHMDLGPTAILNDSLDDFPEPECVPIERWDEEQEAAAKAASTILSNAEAVLQFSEKSQHCEVTPVLEFSSFNDRFFALLRIGQRTIRTAKSYSSEKEAKAMLYKMALVMMCEGTLDIGPLRHDAIQEQSPLISSGGIYKTSLAPTDSINSENWVGSLQEYTQKRLHSMALPEYNFGTVSTRELQSRGLTTGERGFTCIVTVTINGNKTMVFGSDENHSASKNDAKRAAARSAIKWLRCNRIIEDSQPLAPLSGVKRAYLSDDGVPECIDNSRNVHMHQGIPRIMTAEDLSLPSRIAKLALSLGFSPPAYHYTKAGRDFCAHATFLDTDIRKESKLQGALGRSKGLLSTKLAKHECCKVVLRLLEQIAAERKVMF